MGFNLAESACHEQALFQNESSAESKMWEEALGVHIQVPCAFRMGRPIT